MSFKKVWKQFSYIKNQQWKDTQSEISESRSSRSYRFSKVNFNKSRNDQQKLNKKFPLANIIKTRERSRQSNIVNEFSMRRRQNSFVQKLVPSSTNIDPPSKVDPKYENKIKKFVSDLRKMYDQLKQAAQALLTSFQKIKQEMENKLLRISDQLLKIGNYEKHRSKVHEIIQNGFSLIKKNITFLPASLSQLNNSREDQHPLKSQPDCEDPSSPLLRASDFHQTSKSRTKISSIFTPHQHPPIKSNEFHLQLPLSSRHKNKQRPETERRDYHHHARVGSFDSYFNMKDMKESQDSRRPKLDEISQSDVKSEALEKTNKIESIIQQMRQILGQC